MAARQEPVELPIGCQFGCPRAKGAAQRCLRSPAPSWPASASAPSKSSSPSHLLGCKHSEERFQDRNRPLTWRNVELRGLEPLASCMPCKSSEPPARAAAALTCEVSAPACPVSACKPACDGRPLGGPLVRP